MFLGARRSQERKARRGVKTSSTPRGGSAGRSDESSREAERERPDGRSPAGVRPVGREGLLWSDVRFSEALAE